MSGPTREEMLELGRATGRVSTRDEAEAIIAGLMGTVRSIREESGHDNAVAWSLMAAIEGLRETMPRLNEKPS